MATHAAIVTTAPAVLEQHMVPTVEPRDNQVLVINQYTASTPLDLHQADGHLLVRAPQILGDGVAGTVLRVGPDAKLLRPGDQVFGFTWRTDVEKAHQLYVVAPENLLGKIPEGKSMREAVTLGNNFVTVWHTFVTELGMQLPWPRPEGWEAPLGSDEWILVWGGASSCGMYALQLLRYYGYRNVIAVASQGHHEKLRRYGAAECFSYRDEDVVMRIRGFVEKMGGKITYALDTIGSLEGSVRPVSQVVTGEGSKVAVLLPVIKRDAAPGVKPEYEMDLEAAVEWTKGVVPIGVRTHNYLDNKLLAEKLQPEIMPIMLRDGLIEPNGQLLVDGKTLLERAEKALSMLREKKVSGERLVWKVAEDEEVAEALAKIRS